MEDKRSFTVVSVGKTGGATKGKENLGGRYISTTPSGAAKKAGRRICKESKIKGRCSLVIEVQETTRGSKHKIRKYRITRELKPKTVVREGTKISFKYKMTAKAL